MTDSRQATSSTRSAAVTDRLRRDILGGQLPPGERLRQAEVAARLDVSTTPVREAFTALAREGLVVRDPHRGVVVFKPTISELRDTYEIRIALEPLAARLAVAHLSEAALDALAVLAEQMRVTADRTQRADLNARFHDSIYALADRPRLVAVIDRERRTVMTYLRLLSRSPDVTYQQIADDEHAAIIQALRDRDPAAAHQCMRAHLARHRAQIEGIIVAEGLNPA